MESDALILDKDDQTKNVSIVSNFIDTLMSQLNEPSTNSNVQQNTHSNAKVLDAIDATDTEPQLRLDVLLAENRELLNNIDHESQHNSKKAHSHRRATFAHNSRSNLSNYNYYKHYFKRLSTNNDTSDSDQFISQNPIKVHQIWSHTLRSREHNNNNNNSGLNDTSNECGGIWDRLYCDAKILRIKKDKLRQQYIQSQDEKLQALQNRPYNQRKDREQRYENIDYHRMEYDDDTVFNKLYNDYFIRQKKLQKLQSMIQNDWIQQHLSKKSQDNMIAQNHRYHFDDDIPIENRLIRWDQYRQRKLQRKQSEMFQQKCTFKPQLISDTHYNQSKDIKKFSQSNSKVFNRLYSQHKQRQIKQQQLYQKAQKETTFRPNINLSQRKVPAPSYSKRLYKYSFDSDLY